MKPTHCTLFPDVSKESRPSILYTVSNLSTTQQNIQLESPRFQTGLEIYQSTKLPHELITLAVMCELAFHVVVMDCARSLSIEVQTHTQDFSFICIYNESQTTEKYAKRHPLIKSLQYM